MASEYEVRWATIKELKEGLAGIGDIIDRLHLASLGEVSEIGGVVADLVARIALFEARMGELNKEIAGMETRMYEAADRAYRSALQARQEFQRRLDEMPTLTANLPVYEMEKAVEIAGKLAGLTEHQWGRVLALAQAMAGGVK
uniref:Uncharacterized protein n=1 Tax=viral metagenome TaxID=1070528 RepID=A0A6H1Z7Z8_9ZZZZ